MPITSATSNANARYVSNRTGAASKWWKKHYVPKRGDASELPPPFGTTDAAPVTVSFTPTTTITTTTITPTSAAVTVTRTEDAAEVKAPEKETSVITATTVVTTLPPAPEIEPRFATFPLPPLQIWMDQFKLLSGQLVPAANSSNAPAADSQRAKDQLDSWQYNYGDRLLAAAKLRSGINI